MIQKEHKKLARFKRELRVIKMKCFWTGATIIVFALLSDLVAAMTMQQYSPGFGTWELFVCLFGAGLVWMGLSK